ncbi:hypothetical protein VNO77_07972 [Canavalia gladiata]|uniref:Uncharacterized protein n=1 Tax=Canavalia gladiata TaxID=3824 RepID=A0AAN9MET5_CANGL
MWEEWFEPRSWGFSSGVYHWAKLLMNPTTSSLLAIMNTRCRAKGLKWGPRTELYHSLQVHVLKVGCSILCQGKILKLKSSLTALSPEL